MSSTEEQVLADIENIKIPYPSEGIIRTAQLDDTVAPPNSAQLAVNMNFDRIGALRTRPGVTSYADALASAINNYGTLHNEIVPAGYNYLEQFGETSEIVSSSFANPSAVKIDATHIAVFWSDASAHGWCQKFLIDPEAGTVTAIGTALEFESSHNASNKAILVNSNTVLNTWTGTSSHGIAQSFNVLLDSITANSSPFAFDASNGQNMTLAQVDTTHFILFYTSSSSDGVAVILLVNAGTGAVTTPGSPTTFDSGTVINNSCVALGDTTHFVNFWANLSGGQTQCFTVNLSTWAITAVGSPLNFDTIASHNNACSVGDVEHIVNFWENSTSHIGAQCFNVNPSTFAVTTVGTGLSGGDVVSNDMTVTGFGDGFHFVAFYSGNIGQGAVQMYALNPSTFAVTAVGTKLATYDFANSGYTSSFDISATEVGVVWGNVGALEGQAALFESFGAVVEGRWLYAGYGTKVANVPAGSTTWTDRRTGLANVSKPRFTQFLNYVWMVNGNQQIGGDPVATSNGGAFGTDLVPINFPKGDYIHAGFEGRVWIADSTLGVIYYSDIVQFTPPSTYVLTYNPQVNFIETIAPQTGETITGFCEVPRALLVFTQNTITRIYGASSIDAYPAYNVGTYSQESIVTVKNGIYFHHSSGFYQFTPNVYAAQPTEISRRIIDFIQAIPRANYDNITGVYDGFDNIEWAIGPVTVEGVTFSNCVCRFTISTQIWTIYDYVGNTITAMTFYDDGIALNHLMGTQAGKTGAMDTGTTDFNAPFYYEYIDRWRSFTAMYYQTQRIDAVSVYHENAAGANITYQGDNAAPNEWKPLGAINSDIQSLVPNGNSEDFTVTRLRIAGTTKGETIYIHGIEIPQITQKGQRTN